MLSARTSTSPRPPDSPGVASGFAATGGRAAIADLEHDLFGGDLPRHPQRNPNQHLFDYMKSPRLFLYNL